MKYLKLCVLVLLLIPIASLAQKTINTDSVKSYIGAEVTVRGVITQVTITKSGTVYFNMDGRYPDNKMTAVIFKKDVEKFGDLKYWEGKLIGVKGKIEDYKGNPEIILKHQGQISFFE